MRTTTLDKFGMPPRAFALNRQAYDRLGHVPIGDYEHEVLDAKKRFAFADTEVCFNRLHDLQWSIAQCSAGLHERRLGLTIVGSTAPLIFLTPDGHPFLVSEWPLIRLGSTPLGRVTPRDLRSWIAQSYQNFLGSADGNFVRSEYRLTRRQSGKVIIRHKPRSGECPSAALTEDRDRAFWLQAFQCRSTQSEECSRAVQQLEAVRSQ